MIKSLRLPPPTYLIMTAPNILEVLKEDIPLKEINQQKETFYVCVLYGEEEEKPRSAVYLTIKQWDWLRRGFLGDMSVQCNGITYMVSSTKLDILSLANSRLELLDEEEELSYDQFLEHE